MLTIVLDKTDDTPIVILNLEHSLVSLSKWESIHEKPFFGREPLTAEETVSYFMQALLTEIPPEAFADRLTAANFQTFNEYINSKQTATWFREDPHGRPNREVVTNELIYYWMIQFQIPFEPCQDWHVNHLMTLIKICGIKQTKPRKMSRAAQMEQYRSLNAQRRAQLGTSG